MSHRRAVDAMTSTDPKFNHWKARFHAAIGAFESGSLTEARTLVFRALAEAEQLDERAFAVPACHVGIGVLSLNQGNLKESREYFDKGLSALSGKSDDASRELYSGGLRLVAQLYESEEKPDEAERVLRESVDILTELGSASVVQLAYALSDLSFFLVRQGRVADAEIPIESAVEILSVTVGQEDPAFERAKMIFQVCATQNEKDDLMYVFELSAKKQLYQVGDKHPSLVKAVTAYATALKKQGLSEKLEEVKQGFSRILKGFDSP